MATQVLEGTWEEITKQSKRLVGKQLRVTILDDKPTQKRKPNVGMFEALRRISERNENMPETYGECVVDIIRRGRAGEMFGYEPDEQS